MRVLLYEPWRGGHHDVVLRYVRDILTSGGHEAVTVDDAVEASGGELAALRRRAADEGCDLVHVLTADGQGRRWLRELRWPRLRTAPAVPVLGTYYLYDNLARPLRGASWDMLVATGQIDRLLISDDFWAERRVPWWRRHYVRVIPDPWKPEDFPFKERAAACAELSLNPNRIRFLIFGDLSARKGVELAVEAFAAAAFTDAELLLAGRWHSSLAGTAAERTLRSLVVRGAARLDDGYVAEAAVSAYFHASDYVLCTYPASFTVSSNTFTRAMASGRPVVAAAHGVVGRTIREAGCGLTYRTGSVEDLVAACRQAVAIAGSNHYREMAGRGRDLARSRTTDAYGKALLSAYHELLRK